MCGIVGIIDYDRTSSSLILRNMTETLYFRGPDDEGNEFIETDQFQLGFGHRRLSILDLSTLGHQPMMFQHYIIIFNGEIYNFNEIKKELLLLNYEFNSHSDTEVILKSFDKWGINCIHKFRGMFAFSIYDKILNKIYVFRDRVGVKPLYYYSKNGLFLYSSELKALYKHPKFEKIINKQALSLYLQFGYIQAPYTIFEDTYKLEPGHFIEYDLKLNEFEIKSYWNIENSYFKEKETTSYNNALNTLEEILTEAFLLRMVSDVSVGTFLSGGIDSTLVTAILQKNTQSQLNTFTIGFEEVAYNEAPYAKNIAKHLNTKHTEYYCSNKDAMEIIQKLSFIYDEPFGDSSAIPTTLVSYIAKKDVSVVLSGDGGDEVFCGYSSYSLFEQYYKKINAIPYKKFIKSIFNCISDPLYKMQNINEKYYLKYLKLKNTLEHDDISNMYKVANSVFTKDEIEHLLADSYFYIQDNILNQVSDLEKMMISDFKGYLSDDILVKVDRASMSVSLETREPLLDHRIIEYAATLPIEYKTNKRILKDILLKYVPEHLFQRPKTGFGIPINDWLKKDLKFLIDYYLDDNRIISQKIFNINYIRQLKELFFHGKCTDRKIWTILMFQMWYEENVK